MDYEREKNGNGDDDKPDDEGTDQPGGDQPSEPETGGEEDKSEGGE